MTAEREHRPGAGCACVVLQPSFVPWRGYFDLIRRSDVFVFYDDVQYDKHGWRNRNRVKTAQGPCWLTVPVHAHGAVKGGTPIREIRIDWSRDWRRRHRLTLEQSYRRAPHRDFCAPLLERIYGPREELLVDLTIPTTIAAAELIGCGPTEFVRSSELDADIKGDARSTERLLAVLGAVGATRYISGPSARAYLDEGLLLGAGITLEYMSYRYPEYPQLHPPFDAQLSILDLLFMTGPEAASWIRGGRAAAGNGDGEGA